jgi:ADP-ribose pyrophosphatase
LLEIPAGTLEPDEPPEKTAPRELKEETGYSAQRWESLGRFFPSPGVLSEEMYLFLARDLAEGTSAEMDDEDIEVEKIPLHEALEMVARGEIADAKSIVGLLLAYKLLDRMTTP